MPTYKLLIAYDGSGFHGYARQPNVRTVQGEFETALFRQIGEVETSVAGRTDKGVHAVGQVVSFSTDEILDGRTLRSLNRQLAPEISVLALGYAPDGFSARFSATERGYVYRVLNREAPDPFLAKTAWHVEYPLDIELMNRAAAAFVGQHDFASLCRKSGHRSTERDVRRARWRRGDMNTLEFHVAASSFCHQMVRSMVAICVDVGRGKIDLDAVPDIVAAKDRHVARGAAPPHGLTLVDVQYDSAAKSPPDGGAPRAAR
jgi:tRNA pseudouridine38-40 synthase